MSRHKLPPATYLLSLGQALNLTAAVLSVSMAAIVGSRLAPSAGWATVPYGAQFTAVMLVTYPISLLMKARGRRVGFVVGALLLLAAGAVGYLSVARASFAGLIAAHVLLGAYLASANFFRFAAVDGLDEASKARAMSWVVAGGVLAAVIGPWVASHLRSVAGYTEFSLSYAFLVVLGLATLAIMAVWRPAVTAAAAQPSTAAPSVAAMPTRLLATAMFVAAGGFFVMNLLMVQASLVLRDICSFDQIASAIQWHVLAMFAPSFITGGLIARWGLRTVLMMGAVLLALAAGIGLTDLSYAPVAGGLLVLGLGWNFAYVGGGTMLAKFVPEHARHQWQGLNDTLIAVCATIAAFAPAPLLALFGWRWTNLACLGIAALIGVVCWLTVPAEQKRSGIAGRDVLSK